MINHQNLALLFKAITFAAEKHKFQKRKGQDKTPYINHPLQVADLLIRVGGQTNTTLIAAAILNTYILDQLRAKY